MKKKIILLSIIIFPSLIYFFFELTQANFKKMPYFGPKTVNEKGDTVYWTINSISFDRCWVTLAQGDAYEGGPKKNYRVVVHDTITATPPDSIPYCILFLNPKYRKEGYKLDGLVDYLKYKAKDLKDIPLYMIASAVNEKTEQQLLDTSAVKPDQILQDIKKPLNGEFDSIPLHLPNIIPGRLWSGHFAWTVNHDSLLSATYFKGKPEYVFDYFMVLVDKKRHIRGYYDPSFNAEVKRMIDEYKHLKIRDEYAQTLKQNDIKQNEKK